MTKRPFTRHTPPPHPNWTGRTYRTSEEAYGSQIYFSPTRQATPRRWIVAVCIAILAVLAGASQG